MIKVSVLYPYVEDGRFNVPYYVQKHMPMVQATLGESLRGIEVTQGIPDPRTMAAPHYRVLTTLYFESIDSFHKAVSRHGDTLRKDLPHFTDIQPETRIGQVIFTQ